MLELMTMAVLLVVGTMGGAVLGIVYTLHRKPAPTHWTVVEGWEQGPRHLFARRYEAEAHIDKHGRMGEVDAFDWVIRGVVLLREEGDPR